MSLHYPGITLRRLLREYARWLRELRHTAPRTSPLQEVLVFFGCTAAGVVAGPTVLSCVTLGQFHVPLDVFVSIVFCTYVGPPSVGDFLYIAWGVALLPYLIWVVVRKMLWSEQTPFWG